MVQKNVEVIGFVGKPLRTNIGVHQLIGFYHCLKDQEIISDIRGDNHFCGFKRINYDDKPDKTFKAFFGEDNELHRLAVAYSLGNQRGEKSDKSLDIGILRATIIDIERFDPVLKKLRERGEKDGCSVFLKYALDSKIAREGLEPGFYNPL